MKGLRPASQCYIAALALATAGALAAAFAARGLPSAGQGVLALVLAGLVTVAWLFPIHFAFKTKQFLDTPVLFAAVFLCDPGPAMLVAAVGVGLAHALRRETRDLPQAVLNAAQATLQVAAGALIAVLAGWEAQRPAFAWPAMPLVFLAVAMVMFLVGTLAVATVVGLEAGSAPLVTWYRAALAVDRTAVLPHLPQYALGLLAVIVAAEHPWALAPLALAAVAIHGAMTHHVERYRGAEAALRSSGASLASGRHEWSEEVYRILGFTPAPSTRRTRTS